MSAVLVVVCLIFSLVALDVAALLWGADSRDGLESPEWERRRTWNEDRDGIASQESGRRRSSAT